MSTSADAVARTAARALRDDSGLSIANAIALARHRHPDAPVPGHGRVRQHLRALTMQAEGAAAYTDGVIATLEAAAGLMTILTEFTDRIDPILVGRAARGHVDGPGDLHIRLYMDEPIDTVEPLLEQYGYEIRSRKTANTRFGRLSRLIVDDDAARFVLTRCLRVNIGQADRHLYRDEQIATADVDEVRALITTQSQTRK